MIKSFLNKETRRIFHREYSKTLPENIQNTAYRKLVIIDSATRLKDLRNPPGNKLKKLKGSAENRYSIRVNSQWRICFTWVDNDAYEVGIVDYH